MRILKPSYEILDLGLINAHAPKMAEYGARQCYQSTHRIAEGSWRDFVEMLVERGHTSALEHGAVYLEFPSFLVPAPLANLKGNPYTVIEYDIDTGTDHAYTNLRVLHECCPIVFDGIMNEEPLPHMVSYFVPEKNDPNRRVTVELIVDRGVTHELVRHRVLSFSQESTRYCNYIKERFGSEISVISVADFLCTEDGDLDEEAYNIWVDAMDHAEAAYNKLIKLGYSPQIARGVLPNNLKANIILSGSLIQWRNFFKLRTPVDAHPQMREIILPLYDEMKELYPYVSLD